MMKAKVAADLSGTQPRMDEVSPNLFIGNKFAAEDAHFLALNKISHVLNMADTVGPRQVLTSELLQPECCFRTAGTLSPLPGLSCLSTTLTSSTSR